MRKRYLLKSFPIFCASFLLLIVASCKKDTKPVVTPVVKTATPSKLGLYEADSSIYKLLFTAVSQIGTKTVNYGLIFDTGSGGMVIDATDILPAAMVTSSGITVTGDSTVVNGITVTSQKSVIEYGDDDASTDKVYGNLAYAPVTVGDANGNIVIKRLPFFIYYKAVDSKGNLFDAHEFDTFGVCEEYDISFPNGANITSPYSYFDPGTGLTRGFKIAAIGTDNFSIDGTYVPGVVTLGLTADDLSSSSGFVMSQLSLESDEGYPPLLKSTVTYSGKAVSTYVLFDTGTEPYGFIEDPTYSGTISLLPNGTPVTLATNSGFNYAYTITSSENLTYVENPTTTGGDVTIESLEFFLNNEYLIDFANHKLGLKNN